MNYYSALSSFWNATTNSHIADDRAALFPVIKIKFPILVPKLFFGAGVAFFLYNLARLYALSAIALFFSVTLLLMLGSILLRLYRKPNESIRWLARKSIEQFAIIIVSYFILYGVAPNPAPLFRYKVEPTLAALSQFYEKNGHYPDTVTQLVPKYLSAVQNCFPACEESFVYMGGEQNYFLSFREIGNEIYFNPKRGWMREDTMTSSLDRFTHPLNWEWGRMYMQKQHRTALK